MEEETAPPIIFLTAQTKNKKSKIIWAVIKINVLAAWLLFFIAAEAEIKIKRRISYTIIFLLAAE